MSDDIYKKFINECETQISDQKQRRISESSTEHYGRIHEQADSFFERPKLLKQRLVVNKHKALHELHNYVVEFEQQFQKNGGKIVWVSNREEAHKEILHLLKEKAIKRVVCSNSATLAELQWKPIFQDLGISYLETELQAFVSQLKELPFRYESFPVLNLTIDELNQMVRQHFKLEENDYQAVLSFINKYMINQCHLAQASVMGANFLVASHGAVVCLENEGNIGLGSSFADIQIVVAGIDKIIPHLKDVDAYVSLLAANSCGTQKPYQTHLFFGPRTSSESDGPKEMFLFLVDNKRTEVLRQLPQRRIFHCIHCGACTSVCPIFQLTGSKLYGDVYQGPPAAVVNPYLESFYRYGHLTYACTLCKRCTEVCPMNIPIHELILANRADAIKQEHHVCMTPPQMKLLRKMMLKRKSMSSRWNNFILKWHFKKYYRNPRLFPDLSVRSYNIRWKELNNIK